MLRYGSRPVGAFGTLCVYLPLLGSLSGDGSSFVMSLRCALFHLLELGAPGSRWN